MNVILLLTSIFYLANTSYAQFTNSDSQYLQAENILINGGFENGKTKWVNTSGGTFTIDSSVKIKGNYSAKLVLSAQTVSLTQSSTLYASAFTDGSQGLVSARIKSDVALKLCAIKAGVVSTTDCLDIVGDNQWGHFQVPTLLGATSNGISIASSGNVTGTVFVDDTFVGLADPFVSAPLITEWVDFPSVAIGDLITGTTTNPTYGTVVTNKAQWRRVGSDMEIRWDYRQTTAGLAGSGDYLFNLPPGYQIDTTRAKANTSLGNTAGSAYDSASIGIFWGYSVTTTSVRGAVGVYSSTKLKSHIINSSGTLNPDAWGSASGAAFSTSAAQTYGLHVTVPILGWSSSINTITQQCQNDTECANEFSADVTAITGVVASENLDWITGNASKAGTGRYVLTFNPGIFTVAPTCIASPRKQTAIIADADGNPSVFATATQVEVLTEESTAGSAIDHVGISNFTILCQKSGTDYKARRAIVGSFKNVVTTQGVNKPTTSSAIVAGGTESTICTVTGNCTLYRPRGNFITSVAKTATGGSYTVTLDSTKINVSTVSCFTNVIRDTSGNQVCHPSTMGATFTVFCRDVTSNAVANNMFRLSCEGDSL